MALNRIGQVGNSLVTGAGVYADIDAGSVSPTQHEESTLICTFATCAMFRVGDNSMDGISATYNAIPYV